MLLPLHMHPDRYFLEVHLNKQASKVRGSLRLAFHYDEALQQTRMKVCEQQPPLKVVRAFALPEGGALVHLHNLSGGVLGGDELYPDTRGWFAGIPARSSHPFHWLKLQTTHMYRACRRRRAVLVGNRGTWTHSTRRAISIRTTPARTAYQRSRKTVSYRIP